MHQDNTLTPFKEIAARMHLSSRKVRSLYSSGMRKLRKYYSSRARRAELLALLAESAESSGQVRADDRHFPQLHYMDIQPVPHTQNWKQRTLRTLERT